MSPRFKHQWQRFTRVIALLLSGLAVFAGEAGDIPPFKSAHYVSKVAGFRALSGSDFLDGCDFHLTGVITLVDTNRDLIVLQDDSGAVALNFPLTNTGLHLGQRVSLLGTNCTPYFSRFPAFPLRPSGRELCNSFEGPTDSGEYYLARMRGYLHPKVSGEYSFWIASDNSSELWLSTDNHPSKARKIASIPRFGWVAPHDWSHFPSQHSDPVWLKAGESYYIEALQEQTTVADNLAVAWQGPGLEQSVIAGRFLTPCGQWPADSVTNGILREFWTNYLAGDLANCGGGRPFQSALSVANVTVHILGEGQLPDPKPIVVDRPLQAEGNYRWVKTEGRVKFVGGKGNSFWFEIADGPATVKVRTPRLESSFGQRMQDARVRVEGVCEGVYDQSGNLVPGLIWTPGESGIQFIETARTNVEVAAAEHTSISNTNPIPGTQPFYAAHGIVTFNDRVFDKNYIFIQEDDAVVLISGGETAPFQKQLKVGESIDFGGAVQPGSDPPVVAPLVITQLGRHAMPDPVTEQLDFPIPANRVGKWTEVKGVVHSINTNGTLSVFGKNGLTYLWIGQTPASVLASYVDATLCVRGVLSPNLLDAPLLLVPSQEYIDVVDPAPPQPFEIPRHSISNLVTTMTESLPTHRVKTAGEIIYVRAHSFFLQDESGGICVQPASLMTPHVGDTIEVLAFLTIRDTAPILTAAETRPAKGIQHVTPNFLNAGEDISPSRNGTLVSLTATVLGRTTNEISQVLELQEQHRVFAAVLSTVAGKLPDIAAGSRVRIIGVCDDNPTAFWTDTSPKMQFPVSLNILLRNPADVAVLNGPPWWTLKRTIALTGTLLAVIPVTLLWIHLLQRRLERQNAAQLAFSRRLLERLEDERRRIAVNLHDSLGQILLAIKNHAMLAIQRPADGQGTQLSLEEISNATSQAIEEVRQITRGLRPYQLDRLGLTQAIRASVSQASATDAISFASRVENIDGLFDKDAEIHVYRIVQEAVTNVVKHSAATEAAVVIKKRDGAVTLSIRDNGHGFDLAKLSLQLHDIGYGLSGIAERVRILEGTLEINSRPGAGTSLTVEVPL